MHNIHLKIYYSCFVVTSHLAEEFSSESQKLRVKGVDQAPNIVLVLFEYITIMLTEHNL